MKQETKGRIKAEVCWAYTRTGAFQRSWIYINKNVDDEKKKDFRNKVKEFLYQEVFLKYQKKKITASKLLKLIDKMISHTRGHSSLEKRRLQFGNAQKFVNLYLKAMWITSFGKIPPHFPVDRIIISDLHLGYNWTDMGKAQYKIVIAKARKLMNGDGKYRELANWEAAYYQEKYIDGAR